MNKFGRIARCEVKMYANNMKKITSFTTEDVKKPSATSTSLNLQHKEALQHKFTTDKEEPNNTLNFMKISRVNQARSENTKRKRTKQNMKINLQQSPSTLNLQQNLVQKPVNPNLQQSPTTLNLQQNKVQKPVNQNLQQKETRKKVRALRRSKNSDLSKNSRIQDFFPKITKGDLL